MELEKQIDLINRNYQIERWLINHGVQSTEINILPNRFFFVTNSQKIILGLGNRALTLRIVFYTYFQYHRLRVSRIKIITANLEK